MKKRLALILALAMMATTVLAGCGSKEDTSDADEGAKTEDAQEVDGDNDDTTFVVGFDAAFPPYGYKDDNGEYVHKTISVTLGNRSDYTG